MDCVLDQQKTYRCEKCFDCCIEMFCVLDDQTLETIWVCEECSHKYDVPTDPDCIID